MGDGMDDSWKVRLAEAVEASRKSKRSISIEANLGVGYLHAILVEDKDPTIGNLRKICAAIPVSITAILTGADITSEEEQIISLLRKSSTKTEAVVTLLKN
jgi:hypothetical protein